MPDRRTTVVHIITKLELGGAQENTLATCRDLDPQRFHVALLHGPDGYLDERARAMKHVDVEVVPQLVRRVQPWGDLACAADLRRRIVRFLAVHEAEGGRRGDFIVHTHSSKAGILGRAAAKAAGAPIVVHTIHGFGFHDGQGALEHGVYLNAERAAARFTDAFIGVSRANLAEAEARGVIDERHAVELIRSGFDLEPFRRPRLDPRAARAELGLGDDEEVVVCVANLKPQKDPLTLVEAFSRLLRKRPKARLIFAGDGPLRAPVEARIRDLDLANAFELLGWHEEVPVLMSAADIVVLPSLFEGLPRAAVQSIAARRPFVGTRVDGTPEIIREGRNGFLVEPRSPDQLAGAMDRALEMRPVDPDDVERVLEWEESTMVRNIEAFYDRLTAR